MNKSVIFSLLALSSIVFSFSGFASALAYGDEVMIEVGPSDKVFVLKHTDGAKGAAFVRTSDTERLAQMIAEGYEVVAKEGPNGAELVLGDVIPEDVAQAEATQVAQNIAAQDGADFIRDVDMGIGINLGLTTGGKARLLATVGPGLVVGVDLDIGTVIFLSEMTASAILGWSFEMGRQAIRPYVTLGAGRGGVFALLAAASGSITHTGIGLEWKPARWFGLGLEGGMNVMGAHTTQGIGGTHYDTKPIEYPYARLNFMFYFI
ncbi:hypothetical protein WDW86_01335 [Bdellovibrionota bacterium FG-2]